MTRSIQEYLGLPKATKIREKIKHEILLMPTPEDIKGGKISDPKGCALHNAACRMYDIPNCAIGPRISFIPQRDHKGELYIARVAASGATRRAIIKFDRSGKMPLGGFRFLPLAKADTYAGKEMQNAKYLARIAKGGGPAPKAKPIVRRKRRVTRSIPYVKAA